MQGQERTAKQGNQGAFRVTKDMIGPNGRGNFPTHHVLKKSQKGYGGSGWVHMGSFECSGVHLDGGTGKQGETRQFGDQDMFCTDNKNT